MLPSRSVKGLTEAIARAQARLLSLQAPDGHWVGELEADTTITAEYLLLGHLIDRVNRRREQKAVQYLRRRQRDDGGFDLFPGGPTNLSATIKAYFAMKMAGVPVSDPAMVRARERILEMGGPLKANGFTKIQVALFGEQDWHRVPAIPVRGVRLAQACVFDLCEVTYWPRTVILPLLVVLLVQPGQGLP